MRIPVGTMCLICNKVFCCSKCRIKHEEKNHDNTVSCPICYNQNLALDSPIDSNLLNHLKQKHPKLHCVKCLKVYSNMAELTEFTKCIERPNNNNQNNNQKMSVCISTQTSPFVSSQCHLLTPELQIQNKLQNKTTLTTHHNNSSEIFLKNVSVINSSFQPKLDNAQTKGKLVRSTSTPVQDFGCKKNVFDGSAEQMANIYRCNGTYTSTSTPPIPPPKINILTCKSPQTDQIAQRISKHHMTKAFTSKPVTPLRQVMSNSIRRAITEHGTETININNPTNKSKYFHYSNELPLDLRTSPALRRVHSEIVEKSCFFDHFHSSKTSTRKSFSVSSKNSMESISIKSTRKSTSSISINQQDLSDLSKGGTLFRTCRSIEVITTELNEVNVATEKSQIYTISSKAQNHNHHNSVPYTPKGIGAIKKKTIDFKTPDNNSLLNTNNEDDVFYTPQSIFNHDYISNEFYDTINDMQTSSQHTNNNQIEHKKIINQENQENNDNQGGILWSLVNSIIRLPILKKKQENNNDIKQKPSLIKRCASFAGYLSKSNINNINHDELQSLKRKRTMSNDISRIHSSSSTDNDIKQHTAAKRIKRIHGRKPINRMRDNY